MKDALLYHGLIKDNKVNNDIETVKNIAETASNKADNNASDIDSLETEYKKYVETVKSELNSSIDNVSATAASANTNANTALDNINKLSNKVNSLINDSTDGLELGNYDYDELISNDGLFLRYLKNNVIYLSELNTYINNLHANNTITITDGSHDDFIMSMDSSGNLLIN